MEQLPYDDEQMKELKEWLNKLYEIGEVHIPDSIKEKLHRLITTVDSLRATVIELSWDGALNDAEDKIKELEAQLKSIHEQGRFR